MNDFIHRQLTTGSPVVWLVSRNFLPLGVIVRRDTGKFHFTATVRFLSDLQDDDWDRLHQRLLRGLDQGVSE